MQTSRYRQLSTIVIAISAHTRRWARHQTPGVKASLLAGILLLLRWMRPAEDLQLEATFFSANVSNVVDGDTLELSTGDRIRLAGIDTPEVIDSEGQLSPDGEAARDWLRDRILTQPVRIRTFGARRTTSIDRFGRIVAWIYDTNGNLINQQIVELGISKLITDYGLPNDLDPALRRAEAIARCRERGIWRKDR